MDLLAWINTLTALLQSWAAEPWAAWLAFPLAMLDGFFPPAPADTFMTGLVSLMGTDHPARLVILIVCGALGALAGDTLLWRIGRHIRPSEDSRLGRLTMRGLEHADGHWGTILSTARFIPVIRIGLFLGAGAARVPLRSVLLRDGFAAALWSSTHLFAGLIGGAIAPHPLIGMLIGCALGASVGLVASRVAEWLRQRTCLRAEQQAALTAVARRKAVSR